LYTSDGKLYILDLGFQGLHPESFEEHRGSYDCLDSWLPATLHFSHPNVHVSTVPPLMRPDGPASDFNRFFSENLGKVRPSCMPAFSDAMDGYRATTTDYLEVLYQYGKIFALVPDLLGAIRAFLSSRGSGDTLLHLADLFSSTELQKKFGLDTAGRNWIELNKGIAVVPDEQGFARVSDAILRLGKPQTLYGSLHRDFDELMGLEQVRLRTGVKLRLRGVDSALILKFLGLDATGILPRFGRLWDLVPFSWLVDWFTGLSSRYNIIDNIILAYIVGVEYAVYTYHLQGPIPVEILDYSNVVAEYSDPPEFNAFFREVSRVVPLLTESDIDFVMGGVHIDWGILTALLWQIIRSAL